MAAAHDEPSPSGSPWPDGVPASRSTLIDRWLSLTRHTLPRMAAAQRWPIRLDHCFMRVCLDDAVGVRWDTVVQWPAVHHLTDAQLARAVATAERIQENPDLLPYLNEISLQMRRKPSGAS